MSIKMDVEVLASVPTPSGTAQSLYLDSVTNTWKSKSVSGTSTSLGAALTAVAPQDVGAADVVGTGTAAAREDHVHAFTDTSHGARAGGSLHANVVAAGAAGFMTGADKTKLDGVSSGAAAVTAVTPQNVGAASAVGTGTAAAREDHVHGFNDTSHGARAGGTLHANVVAAGAAGFMTGADKTKLDGVSSGAAALTAVAPQDVGSAATVGTGTAAAREDHVHNFTDTSHGARAGGTLHAVAVNGGANGFLSGTDKTKLDTVASNAAALTAVAPADVGSAATVGVATTAARQDHVHAFTDTSHGARAGGSLHANVVAAGAAGFMTGADKTKLDGVSAGAAAITAVTPQNVGAASAVGTGTAAAREDHVHGFNDTSHGARAGGTLHANVVAAGAAGFMTGTDKSKLDGVSSGAAALTAVAPQDVGSAAAVGTGTAAAKEDHVHNFTDTSHGARAGGTLHAVAVNGGANGFLSGTDKTKLDTVASNAAALTAVAPADVGATAVVGVATTAARQDHVHAFTDTSHGARAGGTLHANATTAVAGFMTAVDKIRMAEVYDAQADFGFVGDLVSTNGTTSMGAATTTLTDSSNPFTAADVGKRITVPRAGTGTGVNATQLTTTIAAFVNAGQVTLSAASTNAVTNVGVSYGTDNTTAITTMVNTINGLAFPGARIVFGESKTNAYGFPTVVQFNKTCQLEGMGGSHTTDSGDYTRTGGTRLAWWGTSSDGGTAFQSFITFVPTGVQALKHPAVRRLWLDCRNNDQNQALVGIKFVSCHGMEIDDVFVNDALASGIRMDIGASPTGDAADTTRWLIKNFCSRQLDNTPSAVTTAFTTTSAVTLTATGQSLTVAANTLPTAGYVWIETSGGNPVLVNYTGGGGTTTLTACTVASELVIHTPKTVSGSNVVQATPGNGAAMLLDGGSVANTCCATILQAQLSHGTTWGPAAIETRNADSIDFISVYINGGNNTNDGAINRQRKPGVRLNGSIVSVVLASRNITFRGGSAGAGGVSAMALDNTGARLLSMSGPNYWDLYQLGNGEALPTIEGNCYFDWNPNGGYRIGQRGLGAVVDQALVAATLTNITGSLIVVPPQGFQVGTTFKWIITGTTTAAGTATNSIFIRYGANGTTADTAIATFTTAAGVATAGGFRVEIEMVVRTLGASGTAIATCTVTANANAGFVTTPNLLDSGAITIDTTQPASANRFLSVSFTTGAAKVPTIRMCTTQILNPANPQ